MRACFSWIGGSTLRAVLGLLITGSLAAAQGFYFKEVRRDDRIYVFNIAAEAERFERTGEMGRALTRVGAGPNGETVVADSERALQLFFFKYGIAEVVPEPAPATSRVEWRDGKTRVTTDNAYLELSSRIQVRYTHEFPDDETRLPGTEAAGDDRGSFRIRRAKVKFEGWIWKPWVSFETQVNFANVTSSNPGSLLEDAALDLDLTQGKGAFRVHVGQFKVPFGHQELTSAMNQTFADRSIVSNEFFRGRDIGAAVWGTFGGNRFEYRAGVFNGNGLTRSANDNDKFQYNARFMWQPNGSQPLNQRAWVTGALYSESDFESTTTPIYAVAVNFEHNDFTNSTQAGNLNDTKGDIVALDGQFKFKGFYLTGAYNRGWRETTGTTARDFDSSGFLVQASKLLNRGRTWEAAFRYSGIDPTDATTGREVRGGLNYYLHRHNLKIQGDIGHLSAEVRAGAASTEHTSLELRIQTQFVF